MGGFLIPPDLQDAFNEWYASSKQVRKGDCPFCLSAPSAPGVTPPCPRCTSRDFA